MITSHKRYIMETRLLQITDRKSCTRVLFINLYRADNFMRLLKVIAVFLGPVIGVQCKEQSIAHAAMNPIRFGADAIAADSCDFQLSSDREEGSPRRFNEGFRLYHYDHQLARCHCNSSASANCPRDSSHHSEICAVA